MASRKSYAAIDPAIWTDPWFIDLDNAYKLVFIYLITTDLKNCTGIYEIHRHTIASGSVQSREDTDKALDLFAEAGKIYYENNHIIIANWMKRTHYNTEDVRNFVINYIKNLPRGIKDKHPDIVNAILEGAGQGTAQGTGQDTGQGGIVNKNKNKNKNMTPPNPPSPIEAPEITEIRKIITRIRNDAVGIKMVCNLTNDQIKKLVEKYSVDKLTIMLPIYYNWKMAKQIKRNDYLTIINGWVEEEANKRQAAKPPTPVKRDDLPDGWDTWSTEQKREYNLRRAK